MGKHEKGTPKELSNRTKTKGLQKLKWYCEMCQKQCRDANGFKCHLTSESHQRQLLLFADNEKQFINEFSTDFLRSFMSILRGQYGTRRVRANEVYQEYIREKNHVHMNSTMWNSLTGFVMWLGEKGKCKIDENEKGWYIQYIDQEEETRKKTEQKKIKQELEDEQKQMQQIEAQVSRAKELHGDEAYTQASELIRNEDEKIILGLNLNRKPTLEELQKPLPTLSASVFETEAKPDLKIKRSRSKSRSKSPSSKRRRYSNDSKPSTSRACEKPKRSALDEIREEEERRKEKKNRKDYWMHPGVIVKIVTKKLGPNFYKAKGTIKEMIDDYTAKIDVDGVDQEHVETVIPQIGREMLIVNGAYRGTKATLLKILQDDFMVRLKLTSGLCKGRQVEVKYEDASKLDVDA